jgi:UDP:flavonoid glycosyltransferase YjiC (YdhE family)
MRVFDDPRLVTTRFDGWGSWREIADRYVAPTLGDDVVSLTRAFDEWRPDVMLSATFAPAARLAAQANGVPHVGVSIYPQHLVRLSRPRNFGRALRAAVVREAGSSAGLDSSNAAELTWGISDECVLLHDPLLLAAAGDEPMGVRAVGFPYFDNLPGPSDEIRRAEEWIGRTADPVVLVTAGSFLGVRQRELWSTAAKAIHSLGVRGLFVGPRQPGFVQPAARSDVMSLGFVPLSQLTPQVTAVVHHGGIGTMFATLAAGRPAAVVPQAFDQPHNARLVARAGVGVDASDMPLTEAIARLLNEPQLAVEASEIAAGLTPTDVAVDRVVERVLAKAQEGVCP